MRRRKIIGFIDDDEDELNRLDSSLRDTFDVFTGKSLSEVERKLTQKDIKCPDLWVLDLYFPEEGKTNNQNELNEMNERNFRIAESVRDYKAFLTSIGQGPKGGLDLLGRCQATNAPVVFLTRKGTLEDARECIDRGAADVFKKPMPPEWPKDRKRAREALDLAMENQKEYLLDKFNLVIRDHKHSRKYRGRYMFVLGALLSGLISSAVKLLFF